MATEPTWDPTRLHHGTSITGFCRMAVENMMGAYGGEGQASFTRYQSMAEHFARAAVSMCGDGQLAQYADHALEHGGWDGKPFAAWKGEQAAGGQGVVMTFDRRSLHMAHRFNTVNFVDPTMRTVDLGYNGGEGEECTFKDVRGLRRHFVGASIDTATFETYAAAVLEAMPGDPEAEAALNAGRVWTRLHDR